MACFVDRVVICDAFREPDKHYQLLSGGKSQLVNGRRPSMRFVASATAARGGIGGIVGREASLFEDLSACSEKNEFVNQLRDEVRDWRNRGYWSTDCTFRTLPRCDFRFTEISNLRADMSDPFRTTPVFSLIPSAKFVWRSESQSGNATQSGVGTVRPGDLP